jgi:hypothetical protein
MTYEAPAVVDVRPIDAHLETRFSEPATPSPVWRSRKAQSKESAGES